MSASLNKSSLTLSLMLIAALLLGACQPAAAPTQAAQPTQAPAAADLLSEINTRGTIRISTDLNYAPQSSGVDGAARAADTKCGGDELTANQVEGFDIDTAVEIAKRLGVEPCFVTPSWDLITAGSWGGRWDISVGSMTITKQRQEVLWFSPGYYFTPAQLAATGDSGIAQVEDISGKPVCAGSATTYESYLKGDDIGIPDADIKVPPPPDVEVVSLDTDALCAQAIQAGRTDFLAFMTSGTVVDQAIAQGIPVVKVGSPAFIEKLAVAIDKASPKEPQSLLAAISQSVQDMHTDGTLTASSIKWFGADLTVVP
ncbi:MAG TPA: transporter substrate-binding domain-containing protein [Anaerolineae bacterium]|nr:transporter substrate-binding domain-containing protein [Anaerolineae bacterium]